MKLLIDVLANYQRTHMKPLAPVLVHKIVHPVDEASFKTEPQPSRPNGSLPAVYSTPLAFASALNADQKSVAVFPVVKRVGGIFRDRVGIGRTRNADIFVPYGNISKYHAYFSLLGDEWTLADAGSTNGTTVDGVRIGKELTKIASGQVLAFGSVAVQFYLQAHFTTFLEQLTQLGVSKRM
ncbi:MAG TPA: FHA domain-containing protein [Labilithrix sp.]|nr:FHA domain-containing protein [Labilithrix sp.]